MSDLRSLKLLDIRENKISTLDNVIEMLTKMESLKILNMVDNPVCQEENYQLRIIQTTSKRPLEIFDMKMMTNEDYDVIQNDDGSTNPRNTDRLNDIYHNRLSALKDIQASQDPNSMISTILKESENDVHEKILALTDYVRNAK